MERIETPRSTEPSQPHQPQRGPEKPAQPEPKEGTFRDADTQPESTPQEEVMNTDEEGKV